MKQTVILLQFGCKTNDYFDEKTGEIQELKIHLGQYIQQ